MYSPPPFLFFFSACPLFCRTNSDLTERKKKKEVGGYHSDQWIPFWSSVSLKKCLSWQIISFPADIGHSHNSESNLPPSLDLKTVSNLFLRNGSHPSSVAKLGPHFHHILVQCVMEKRMKKMQETGKKISHWDNVLWLCDHKYSIQSCSHFLLESRAPLLTNASLCV